VYKITDTKPIAAQQSHGLPELLVQIFRTNRCVPFQSMKDKERGRERREEKKTKVTARNYKEEMMREA